MNEIKDWSSRQDPDPLLSDKEKDLLKDATPFEIRTYGSLDQPTVEAMLVGYLVALPSTDKPDTKPADKILEANIKKEMFENRALGDLFENFLTYYREKRQIMTVDDARTQTLVYGNTQNDAAMYVKMALTCRGAVIARHINVDLILDRFLNNHLLKTEDSIYQRAVKERKDPTLGPRK